MFLMALTHVAFKVVGLVVAAMTEAVRALERVLALVAQLVRYQLRLSPECFLANGAG